METTSKLSGEQSTNPANLVPPLTNDSREPHTHTRNSILTILLNPRIVSIRQHHPITKPLMCLIQFLFPHKERSLPSQVPHPVPYYPLPHRSNRDKLLAHTMTYLTGASCPLFTLFYEPLSLIHENILFTILIEKHNFTSNRSNSMFSWTTKDKIILIEVSFATG